MTQLIVMNPTGLNDKSEFLQAYATASMIYMISETQLTEQGIKKETRA